MTYTPDRILYLGAPSVARLPEGASANELMFETGQNTGNLLIGDAIRRHLTAGTLRSVDDFLRRSGEPRTLPRFANLEHLDSALLESSFDVIVIGAANFLHNRFDFGRWASFLESVRLPCVIIGLGAQAPDYDYQVTVPDGTRRMLQIVSERSVSLGVRGHFSAATLHRMGIKNIRVIGCPSMFWNCQPALRVRRRAFHEGLRVSVNGSANVVEHAANVGAAKRVEAALARLSFARGYPYVLQNETELMEILMGAAGACEPSLVDALRHRYGLEDASQEAFIQFVQRNMKIYVDTGQWLSALQDIDFVIGTRFHGCLIGLLGGAPCLMFAHDTRTREMCELLHMPHFDIRDVDEMDVQSMYDAADTGALERAYPALYQTYIQFLDENRLAHRLLS